MVRRHDVDEKMKVKIRGTKCEISGSHGVEFEDGSLLGYSAV
jgi:hypothetical protein